MQINESRFGKEKYNRGHHVEGQWVFAGLESYSRTSFLIAVEKRRRNFVATHQEMDRAMDSYSFRQLEGLLHFGKARLHTQHWKSLPRICQGKHTYKMEGHRRQTKVVTTVWR